MREELEQKKNDLIQDIIFQNGELHGRLRAKNILIAERIKELTCIKDNMNPIITQNMEAINNEIDWLKELADI